MSSTTPSSSKNAAAPVLPLSPLPLPPPPTRATPARLWLLPQSCSLVAAAVGAQEKKGEGAVVRVPHGQGGGVDGHGQRRQSAPISWLELAEWRMPPLPRAASVRRLTMLRLWPVFALISRQISMPYSIYHLAMAILRGSGPIQSKALILEVACSWSPDSHDGPVLLTPCSISKMRTSAVCKKF